MRIALAQINSVLGDFDYNKDKILNFIIRAKEKKAALSGGLPGEYQATADYASPVLPATSW